LGDWVRTVSRRRRAVVYRSWIVIAAKRRGFHFRTNISMSNAASGFFIFVVDDYRVKRHGFFE